MLAEGRVGIGQYGDGSIHEVRLGRQGAQITTDAHGRYHESTIQQQVFSGFLLATTTGVAAGNLVAAAAAASTQFAVWNPPGSGKLLSLLKFSVMVISGTFGVNGLVHAVFNANALSIAGVAGQANYASLGLSSIGRVQAVAAGSALTGGLAPVNVRHADFGFNAAAYASAQPYRVTEIMDGDIVLPPGWGWVPLWGAAGTSLLNGYSLVWEEVPQ